MSSQLQINFDASNKRRHYARAENSPRLQALLKVLLDGGWHSTRELSLKAECFSVGASIQELKDPRNGCEIESRPINGRWEYKLISCPERLRGIL